MANGIVIFGANGSGKTTLGRELSQVLNFKHIDAEDYSFEVSTIPYSKPRSKDTVIDLILLDIEKYDSFVLSAVSGDYGKEIGSMYKMGIVISVPIEIRLQRLKQRSLEQYGKRILVGGDMYDQEQEFLAFVRNRNLSAMNAWAKTLTCPILNLDGSKAISENIRLIIESYQQMNLA